MSFFRENIDAMDAYVPGEQPAAGVRVTKLNTNENPYPPSPRVAAAAKTFDFSRLRLYPEALPSRFRQVVSDAIGMPADWILPANGSDDAIVMICRSMAGAGGRIAYPTPTFTFYETQARVEDATFIEVPYVGEAFDFPLDHLAGADADVTFVANPNSPTGNSATNEQLDELAGRLSGVLVVDEAYADFAGVNALELVGKRENVVVLRTLSKSYSLAGLRVGFAVAQPGVLGGLLKAKQIYNLDAVSAELAACAVEDQKYMKENVLKIVQQRTWLAGQLQNLGFTVWDSDTNFLLARPPRGNAAELTAALKQQNILIRHFSSPRLSDKVRITVGSPEENRILVDRLRDIAN
ncbi:MAG: histidinol-phosphate transaminase [Phycisphaerae bacterium]